MIIYTRCNLWFLKFLLMDLCKKLLLQELLGDGISHVAFGGISLGLFVGVFPIWTAFLVSILGGLGLQKLRSSARIPGDAAVVVVLTSGLAVGVILTSLSGGFSVDLFSFLFGNILLVGTNDALMIAVIATVITAILVLYQKQFLHLTFNEEQAKIAGLNITLLNYLFVVLAAITVVVSMRLVGILLISALIVIPNISAMMFGKGFKKTVGISVSMSIFSVTSGIIISHYLDLAPSGTIVMIAVALLLVTMLFRSIGLISKVPVKTNT